MARPVYVNSAQVEAARYLAKQGDTAGEEVSEAVRKIAEAPPAEKPASSGGEGPQSLSRALRRMGEYLGLFGGREEHEAYGEDDPTRSWPLPSIDITAIQPRNYFDARKIGELFQQERPVLVNLVDMDDVEAKRMVDFMAGLTFARHGHIQRVTSRVFLLVPPKAPAEQAQDSGFENEARDELTDGVEPPRISPTPEPF